MSNNVHGLVGLQISKGTDYRDEPTITLFVEVGDEHQLRVDIDMTPSQFAHFLGGTVQDLSQAVQEYN